MLSKLRTSAPMVIASLALFLAAGGTSLASDVTESAAKLITGKQVKNATLTGADLKNGSVASVDVKDGNLRARDFKAGELPAGAQGPTGPQGATGPQGVTGPTGPGGADGRSALSTLQTGETVRGITGARDNTGATKETLVDAISLPIPAPVALDDAHVDVNGGDEVGGRCTGTATNPTAPPGVVCIYGVDALSLSNQRGLAAATASRFGFRYAADIGGAGDQGARFDGTWAYTAP